MLQIPSKLCHKEIKFAQFALFSVKPTEEDCPKDIRSLLAWSDKLDFLLKLFKSSDRDG